MSTARATALIIVAALIGSALTAAALIVVAPELLPARPGAVTPSPTTRPQPAPADAASSVSGESQAATRSERLAELQDTVTVLTRELADARARLQTLEERGTPMPPDRADGGSPDPAQPPGDGSGPGADFDQRLKAALAEPGVEFTDAVRQALEQIEAERAEANAEASREQAREAVLQMVGARIQQLQEQLGLSDAQVADLEGIAADIVDQRQAAEAAGATPDELAAIDRKGQRAVRDLIGQAAYRDLRKAELERVARPMVGAAVLAAGVTPDQWTEIDRYLDEHIDRVVDNDVRMQTEEMPTDARRELRTETDAMNQAGWQYIRDNILTEEQRRRIGNR